MRMLAWVQSDVIYIYALYERELPERIYRYVGRTNDIKARLNNHKKQRGDYPVAHWIQEVLARGAVIGIEILEELVKPTRAEASIAERNWVMALDEAATNIFMRKSHHYEDAQRFPGNHALKQTEVNPPQPQNKSVIHESIHN